MSTAHFTGTNGSPDSTTSYFMGGQFEMKDGVTKKYYSIAGMMVAVNDGSAVQYLLTDHLGSTVAVTNQTGTLTSQQRYLPFGAARTIPNSPLLGTDFTYTGQRKLDDGMGGIMDYKARFYSPYINRFLQPDSIIPNPANPQAFNRYSYVGNRPVNFNDPSGHTSVCAGNNGDPECYGPAPLWMPSLSQMGITIDERWTALDAGRIQREAAAVAMTSQGLCGEDCHSMTTYQVFREVFGDTTIAISGAGVGCEVQSYGFSCGAGTVGWLSRDSDAEGLIIHEFGHIFDHKITGDFGYGRNVLGGTTIYDEFGRYVEGIPIGGGAWTRTNDGYKCDTYPCQQHPLNEFGGANTWEDFADMFMNLVMDYSKVYGGPTHGFAPDAFGRARYDWTSSYMTIWVPWSIQR